MAKKSKSRSHLPKRIAGIKIPKAVRKNGLAAIGGPLAIAILADALVDAGEATLSRDTRVGRRARRFMRHPVTSMRRSGRHLAHNALTAALTEAMNAFTDTLRHYRETRAADWNAREPDVDEMALAEEEEFPPPQRTPRSAAIGEERPH